MKRLAYIFFYPLMAISLLLDRPDFRRRKSHGRIRSWYGRADVDVTALHNNYLNGTGDQTKGH